MVTCKVSLLISLVDSEKGTGSSYDWYLMGVGIVQQPTVIFYKKISNKMNDTILFGLVKYLHSKLMVYAVYGYF